MDTENTSAFDPRFYRVLNEAFVAREEGSVISLTHSKAKKVGGLPGRAIDATESPEHHYGPGGISAANAHVSSLIADKSKNKVYQWANNYTQKHLGTKMPDRDSGNAPSSLSKQHAIGIAYHLAAMEHPEYQKRVFEAYKTQHPEIIKETGATDYHSLRDAAYKKMSSQTEKQFSSIPLRSEFREDQGYRNSKEMLRDVHLHNHITVYRGGKHEQMNVKDPKTGLDTNEKFRLVHDVFGHGIHGNEFGPHGEEVAWNTHSKMYTPAARAAMSAETRGQNSYVNYMHHNLGTQEAIESLRKEKKLHASMGHPTDHIDAKLREAGSKWNYAPNKAVLLPPEMNHPGYDGHMPDYIKPLVSDIKDRPDEHTLRRIAVHHNTVSHTKENGGVVNFRKAQDDFNKLKGHWGL